MNVQKHGNIFDKEKITGTNQCNMRQHLRVEATFFFFFSKNDNNEVTVISRNLKL